MHVNFLMIVYLPLSTVIGNNPLQMLHQMRTAGLLHGVYLRQGKYYVKELRNVQTKLKPNNMNQDTLRYISDQKALLHEIGHLQLRRAQLHDIWHQSEYR